MAEEELVRVPNLDVAQTLFELSLPESDQMALEAAFLDAVKKDGMAPVYDQACKDHDLSHDAALSKQMHADSAEKLKQLDANIKDAEENLGETEIRDAYMAKAQHYARIGAKEEAEAAFRQVYEKSISVGQRMDVVFYLLRIGFFFDDKELITRNLEKAESLLEEGGDWERRNRLKVYKGLHLLTMREFSQATSLFLDTVSTFTCVELMPYNDFIGLTVLGAVFALPRTELNKKVVKGPEIQEALHDLPLHKRLLSSLYGCKYADFFAALAEVEGVFKTSRYLAQHTRFYVRELRIKAYQQLLQSYRSVTLASIASSFGVTEAFIDAELSRFIAAGRLNCKIDKVAGVVETTRPDHRNAQYQEIIKKGDMMLNRLQKLGQVISI
ncbi:proteasome 26S subunit [Salpingoeca rosetta]|uniref:Proteasome 26S subunit n=1 Tax=Salpingoeca rosetta (strain ATCC 50818 / BSB-021) TaxID=946362 RepID=F2UK19_SALR5|nr:proteasome 26S subunit [Salpingoeca rosetta]EGD77468.1 proteasome 26S subunit [Salpingoeca rosetta]|eukprot:XP_004990356.1 proteasome 26S subunit [Salpingoeca rosetta]